MTAQRRQVQGQVRRRLGALREQTFQRQEKLGIIPAGTELIRCPDLFPAWEWLSDAGKKLYVRQMEVFAGYSGNAGWLLDGIAEMGDLDNTLILCIWGDNGASMEGRITGSFNEMTFLNGVVLDPARQLQLIEQAGGTGALGGTRRRISPRPGPSPVTRPAGGQYA